MSSDDSSGGGGLGIAGVVTVVFITLKVLAIEPVASWSWGFVVFGPSLISLAFWIVIFGLFIGVVGFGNTSMWFSDGIGRRQISRLERKMDKTQEREKNR